MDAGAASALLSDAYNHKVKLIDDKAEVASCRTLAGTGKPGFKDGPGRLKLGIKTRGDAALANGGC